MRDDKFISQTQAPKIGAGNHKVELLKMTKAQLRASKKEKISLTSGLLASFGAVAAIFIGILIISTNSQQTAEPEASARADTQDEQPDIEQQEPEVEQDILNGEDPTELDPEEEIKEVALEEGSLGFLNINSEGWVVETEESSEEGLITRVFLTRGPETISIVLRDSELGTELPASDTFWSLEIAEDEGAEDHKIVSVIESSQELCVLTDTVGAAVCPADDGVLSIVADNVKQTNTEGYLGESIIVQYDNNSWDGDSAVFDNLQKLIESIKILNK